MTDMLIVRECDVVSFFLFLLLFFIFFFFQAEDGIRDWSVTGVQTCALPICTNMNKGPCFDGVINKINAMGALSLGKQN